MKLLLTCLLSFATLAWSYTPNFALSDLSGVDPELFGGAVAMSGSLLVVGASDKTMSFENQGAAFVYTCSKTQCTSLAQLTAFDAADYDNFGYSVAVDGSTVVVGAPSKMVGVNEFQGAAYVYQCQSTGCTLLAKLTNTNGMAFDDFGTSVAVSGSLIVVGADQVSVNGNDGQGQAYLFGCNTPTFSGTCGMISTLDCASCTAGDLFGFSVAVSGNFVTIGAPFSDVGAVSLQGQALIFDCSSPAACNLLTITTTTEGGEESFYGWSVTASSTWQALIGSPFENATAEGQGAVYPVDCSSGSCVVLTPLFAADGAAEDNFGYTVAMSGAAAVFGANGKSQGAGSAYIFDCTVFSECRQEAAFTYTPLHAGNGFGSSVAVSGGFAAVGAPNAVISGNAGRGQSYFYTVPTPVCAAVVADGTSWPRGTLNAIAYGTCQPGYVGTPSRWCFLNGTYGPISHPCTVAPASCAAETYGRAVWPDGALGTTVPGTCISGYSGSPSRKCSSAGVWATNIIAICTRNMCSAFDDGTAKYPTTGSLDTAAGVCDTAAGYTGSPSRVCGADGTWGAVSNPCTQPMCAAETYGKNVFPDTPAGHTATGTCIAGYTGAPQRQCLASGWSTNVANICQRITCAATTALGANFAQGLSQTVVYGTCLPGKTGTARMSCDINGNWTRPIGSCV